MDWRAISRSRSRISMDWRPTSRSRSRPPESTVTFDQHGMVSTSAYEGRLSFPTLGQGTANLHNSHKPENHYKGSSPGKSIPTSSSIPIPGASMLSAGRRSPPRSAIPARRDLASVYEDQSDPNATTFENSPESRYLHSLNYNPSLSAYNSPSFGPSSLPSFGLHGLTRIPSSNRPPPDQRTFPRHVRKTSFDHTVSKDGIFAGVSGRHQLNGKPLSPDSLLGTKRPAEAPHAESMLRADPPTVGGTAQHPVNQEPDQFEGGSPFPSSSFNFSFPPYDGLFDVPIPGTSLGQSDYSATRRSANTSSEGQYHSSARSSVSGPTYAPPVGSPPSANEGLSAAAAAASAAMAEGYAQLNAANLAGVDDSALDYQQLMGLVYPNLENTGNMAQNPYTHVDPTQILSAEQGDSAYQSFHASPSSDGWGNGVNSSSNASPEPYNTSNASTPPSTEGPTNGQNVRNTPRKYIPMKQAAQDVQRKKSLSGPGNPSTLGALRSAASTPDLKETHCPQPNKGGSDDGDPSPTLCTNCQTTNTPLWRRDPEGQPLCKFFAAPSLGFIHSQPLGNACGLFYVSTFGAFYLESRR